MIAAKVQDEKGQWWAFLGANLDHVRRDVEKDGSYLLSTLKTVWLPGLEGMEWLVAGLQTVINAEEEGGGNPPFVPGKTSFFLGKLGKLKTS